MPIAISLYNSTAGDISVSDLPTPVVVPARGSVTVVPPNSQTDVQNSLILREGDLQGKLGVIINGNQVKLANLAIMIGAGGGGGGVTSFEARTGAVVSAAGDYTAAEIDYDDTVLPAYGATDAQGALDAVKALIAGLSDTPVDNEIPAGVIDGVNDTFTLANTPVVGSEHLYKNGIRQTSGVGNDYTIAAAVITFEPGNIPPALSSLLVDYRM